jgi:hypothetical protein
MAMSQDDNNGGEGQDHGGKPVVYTFFIGKEKYETDLPALTGAQIKARVPNVEPGDGLSLEGHGNDPDRLIGDEEVVRFDTQHDPLRFTIVPRANFG